MQFPIAQPNRSWSNRRRRSVARILISPRGTDSVLAPWITFSIPYGPFSVSQRLMKSLALYGSYPTDTTSYSFSSMNFQRSS